MRGDLDTSITYGFTRKRVDHIQAAARLATAGVETEFNTKMDATERAGNREAFRGARQSQHGSG